MAKKQTKTPPIAGDSEGEDTFLIGDAIKVIAASSAYRGEKGFVARYCKNGSRDSFYVKLEKSGEKLLPKTSLVKVAGTKSVSKSTVAEKDANSGVLTHDTTDVDVSILSVNSASTNTFGRRVMDLYEFVSNIRDGTDDMALKCKLKEVEKMIIGLSLNE